MQKDEFIKILNAIVDARIKKVVPAIVKKELAEYKEKLVKEIKEGTAYLPEEIEMTDLAKALKEEILFSKQTGVKQPAPTQQKVTKTFTKDTKLNAILQQTAEEIRAGKNKSAADDESMQEYKKLLQEQYAQMASEGDMETFNFNTSNMADIASKRAMVTPSFNAEIEKKVALEVGKKQIEAATGNPEVAGLIMRDYRSLMKAVDEKTKTKRTGV